MLPVIIAIGLLLGAGLTIAGVSSRRRILIVVAVIVALITLAAGLLAVLVNSPLWPM